MLKTPIGRLRFMGFFEGFSLLILVGLAMPLKYWFNIPEAVTVVGSIHGFLFVIYCLVIAYVTYKVRWKWHWPVLSFIVAFIPFGNIALDTQLKKFE
ncbi:DUF3817 domain-containing protein [Jeotgalibacillus proteolyticus]|uniref:DUF3817 domain-containing protein n=1 Tax=Jeotgalibacillus proteolyticus TaxID=2082395 RepID=A0A2S5GG50_9BACL|nr:DUF3817 domain-containing protein [Jeotgalibacillus proteolyticus]PPA71843.1 hypothetical protein C4B60_00240 [Jeotgalibacillus proteolyticus]